jgi:hypothetical protein
MKGSRITLVELVIFSSTTALQLRHLPFHGASGAPLNAKERQAAQGAVEIPETIGSVAVAYNVPGILPKC